MNIQDLLIITDIDGTLLNAPAPIPPRNIEALRRFTAKGGRFAIATGRAVKSAGRYVRQLPVNAPCVLFNGCGVYDYGAGGGMLCATHLPESFRGYLKAILDRFPGIGAQLHDETTMYTVSDPHFVKKYLAIENVTFVEAELDDLKQAFLKLVFVMDPELVGEVERFCLSQGWEDVSFCRSGPYYVELLPRDCDKGSALRQIAKLIGLPLSRVVAIGDFYNDLGMLRAAGTAVTVAEAPEDIKRECALVVGKCEDGALADLVEHLERDLGAR